MKHGLNTVFTSHIWPQVCRRTGDPNKFMFCKRCDGAYHCYCQQPPHKVGCEFFILAIMSNFLVCHVFSFEHAERWPWALSVSKAHKVS